MKTHILITLFIVGMVVNAHSQYSQYTGKSDTLEYPYFFPLLGERAIQEGFDIPYPLGLMLNSFYGTQNMLIDNIEIGFNIHDFQNLYLNYTLELEYQVPEKTPLTCSYRNVVLYVQLFLHVFL